MILISFILTVTLHEMCHALVGRLLGWRFHHMIMGPIAIGLDKHEQVKINLIKDPGNWGGAVATVPRDVSEIQVSDLVAVIIAGPLGSLISGLLFVFFYQFLGGSFYLQAAYLSLFYGVATILPYRVGVVYSVGGKVCRLMGWMPGRQVELAVWAIAVSVMHVGNFSQVDLTKVESLQQSSDMRERYMGAYYEFLHYRDLGDRERALFCREALEAIAASMPLNIQRKLERLTYRHSGHHK